MIHLSRNQIIQCSDNSTIGRYIWQGRGDRLDKYCGGLQIRSAIFKLNQRMLVNIKYYYSQALNSLSILVL